MRTNWIRVRPNEECVVCTKKGWCMKSADGTVVICARVQSDKPIGTKGAGWLHRLNDDRLDYPPVNWSKPATSKPQRDWPSLVERYRSAMTDNGFQHVSDHLGVSVDSLHRLQVGWDCSGCCSTWPMRDGDGEAVGIRTRNDEGKKSISGTDGNGLFFAPGSLTQDHLLICEGPTDTAALLDCGFDSVVGRPSCSGGTSYIIEIVERLNPELLLLIPDNDQAGLSGFGNLAAAIASAGYETRRMDAITPPPGIKDTRDWAQKNRDHLAGRIAASLKQIKQRTETQR